MADNIVDAIKRATKKLYYDKTYTGQIIAKSGNTYTVKIHGREHHVKCNYDFKIGRTVDILAKQNDMSNLSFLVSYDDLKLN